VRSHPLWNPFKTESLESINAARAKLGVRKPALVEVDLTVADSVDEDAWLPDLELAGSELRVRGQLGSDEHRMLRGQQPITNLHVFSPGAVSRSGTGCSVTGCVPTRRIEADPDHDHDRRPRPRRRQGRAEETWRPFGCHC
jgi:hypothetical protein